MDTLPGVVMGGLLTDQWTEEQRDSIRKAQEAIAVVQQPEKVEPETSAPVIVEPVKEEPVKEEPVKKEPVKTETVKAEPTKPAKKEDWDSDLEDLFADLRFGFNETNLSAENQTRLNRVANWMKEHPNAVVNLDGHADYLGTDEVNDVVAEQRALLVWNYLAKNGVDPYQVLYTSQGERKPKVPGQNADGSDNPGNRAINRRVEMDLEQHLMFRVFNFAYSSKEVNAEGLKKIQEVAAFMKANPASKARLSGFTDPGGNPAFNKELSRKRVEAAAQKLKELGIAEGRIQTEYFGQEKPTAPNTSEEYRSLNRRVEIRVD
jgi:outer membrane protein OmpA-like peptidoglycan-associated protein